MARKKIEDEIEVADNETVDTAIHITENTEYEILSRQSIVRYAKGKFLPEINAVGVPLFAGEIIRVPYTGNANDILPGYDFTIAKGLRVCYNDGKFVWIKNTRDNRILFADNTRIDK